MAELAAKWIDLPDPRDPAAPRGGRVRIDVHQSAWGHVLDKHVQPGGEPWAELLPQESAGNTAGADCPGRISGMPPDNLLGAVEAEVRRSLERPLVLLYQSRLLGSCGKHPRNTWLLLLPSGATAYVRDAGVYGSLLTCYFPRAAIVETRVDRRWTCVLRQLVLRYAQFDAARGLLAPGEHHLVFISDDRAVRELRSMIRFVTPAAWGFRAELAGCPWRGRLEPWEGQPAARPTATSRRRLKPPRRIWEDSQDA